MKKYLIPAVMALACIMISCSEDQDPVESMVSGFTTATINSEGYVSLVRDDMGNEYTISEKYKLDFPKGIQMRTDTSYRAVTSLALGENNSARILQDAYVFSFKAPESSELDDKYKVQDPVQINAAYIGGGFLNITMGVKVLEGSQKHSILYARKSDASKLEFTIYHNAQNDGQAYTQYVYLSIPLMGYGLNRNDTVFLSAKGYQEDCNMKLIYR